MLGFGGSILLARQLELFPAFHVMGTQNLAANGGAGPLRLFMSTLPIVSTLRRRVRQKLFKGVNELESATSVPGRLGSQAPEI